jgi:predicted CoA-binding protein
MIPPEMHALIQILLGKVTNSDTQASKWAGEIMNQLREAGYEIAPVSQS